MCIVGTNGVGKSTLLNLIMGDLECTEGEIKRNPRVRIGRYTQHFEDILPMHKTPVQFLEETYKISYQEARDLLGRFGIGGHAHEILLSSCSGGQKARVVMANLTLQNPHILILDEPTAVLVPQEVTRRQICGLRVLQLARHQSLIPRRMVILNSLRRMLVLQLPLLLPLFLHQPQQG